MFIKSLLAATAMLWAIAGHAAVEVNKASAQELDAVRGVGPSMSQRIVDTRKQGEFKSWDDFMARVKGVKEKTAQKLSADGLTVNGAPFDAAKTAPAPAANPTVAAKPAKAAAR